jgi:hypothetical protein
VKRLLAIASSWKRCHRAALVAVAILLAIGAWLTTRAPRAVAASPARCVAFKGKRLLRSRSLMVIVRDEGERREYAFICIPPRGRVHLAGWAFDETIGAIFSVKVLDSAGSWAAILFGSEIDPHGGEEVGKMCNARDGRCYRFFHAFTYGGAEFEEASAQQPGLEAAAVNAFGEILLAETVASTMYVRSVRPDGSEKTLDSAPEANIPPSSLRLVGHEASWIDGGRARRARI